AASSTASAATTSAATFFTRTGFVDRQRAALVLLLIEPLNGRLRFGIGAHFYKTKPLAAPGLTILDDLRTGYRAILAEQLFQIRAAHRVPQIPHIQLLTHGTNS